MFPYLKRNLIKRQKKWIYITLLVAKNTNRFNFFIPAEFSKGGANDEMRIKGIASSEVEDSDGETLVPGGYDVAPLLQTGFLNYNHKGADNPSAIIGEPTKAEIINNGKDLYIEGFLYPTSQKARETYELAKTLEENSPTRRMGFSIEGKVLEKDPFNPKRILKAKITGVAITPCPKNPNTLLSIVKGEYDSLWVDTDEEEDENDTEKAMTAAGAEGVTQTESIDGGKKTFDALLAEKKASLKKSEVYTSILNRYKEYLGDDLLKAQDIFSLVQEFNNKLFDMQNGEILQKALDSTFEFIDEQINLIKSKGEEETGSDDEKDGDETSEDKKEESSKEDDVKKGEDYNMGVETLAVPTGTYGGIDTYLKNIIKGQLEKGSTHEEITADMVEKGINVDVAQALIKGALEEMNALEANGDLAKDGLDWENKAVPASTHSSKSPEGPFNKSIDEAITLIKGEFTTSFESFEGRQSNLVKGIEERFKALGTILKSQSDNFAELSTQVTDLQADNADLKKSLEEAQTRLQAYGSQPANPMKSVVAQAQAVQRFPEEAGIQKSHGSGNVYSLQVPADVHELTQKLSNEFENRIAKGENNRELGDAVLDLTIAKSIDPNRLSRLGRVLQDLNIQIVQ